MRTLAQASVESLRRPVHLLPGSSNDYDALLQRIGNARLVLIAEASHGTQEFYELRAKITKRLIEEKHFDAVAVEADWPDAYRVNRFVHGYESDGKVIDALAGFKQFPTWMWRNSDVVELARDRFLCESGEGETLPTGV